MEDGRLIQNLTVGELKDLVRQAVRDSMASRSSDSADNALKVDRDVAVMDENGEWNPERSGYQLM